MSKCDSCNGFSNSVYILEAEGGPIPDRAVIGVRIKLCSSCHLRPERLYIVNRLCAEVLVPPSYWFGRASAWSSTIRVVRSPRGQRIPRFWYEPEIYSSGSWNETGPEPARALDEDGRSL
jgi:hypothetical protein